jgi:hypothetical protein
MNKIKYLADPSNFDPNISNQINKLKNVTGVDEAKKLLSKEFVSTAQWIIGIIIIVGIVVASYFGFKHKWKEFKWTLAGIIISAILGFLILPSLA